MNFLLQAKITQIKMCINRNYLLSEEDFKLKALYDENPELDVIEDFYRTKSEEVAPNKPFSKNKLRELMSTSSLDPYRNGSNKVGVIFVNPTKQTNRLSKDDVIEIIGQSRNYDTVIAILDRTPSLDSQKMLDKVTVDIQLFYESELQYDISESVFVPAHKRCTDEETNNFFSQTGASTLSVPILLKNDKVSRYYGFRTGELIKIIRDYNLLDMPSTLQISYRLVV